MPELLPTATWRDEAVRAARCAVLPIGSFEQHGDHLPLATDTVIAVTVASEIANAYNLMLLPPITITCSHEHSSWPGTVSISARTLYAVVTDIADSLRASGVDRLLLVNGHGGNYVLSNLVQEATTQGAAVALFPTSPDWRDARQMAGLATDNHDDMHAGELETSVLLHAYPEAVRLGFEDADHDATDRQHLLALGMKHYAPDGVIGRPSLASAEKGAALVQALVGLAKPHVDVLLAANA